MDPGSIERYLLDWCNDGKPDATPRHRMTKGPRVLPSDNMREHDHIAKISSVLKFSQLRICDN